jgi:hypothetical protein
MKKFAYLSILVLFLLVACAPAKDACESIDGFASALRAGGAQVEVAEQIDQEFFSVPAQRLVINGEDIQVLAYSTEESTKQDSSQISADGYAIGTSMVTWIATPHFFQCGNLIALYVGENSEMLNLLESQLGTQFAGG